MTLLLVGRYRLVNDGALAAVAGAERNAVDSETKQIASKLQGDGNTMHFRPKQGMKIDSFWPSSRLPCLSFMSGLCIRWQSLLECLS